MPYYDYRCQTCGHKFDTFSSIADMKSELQCPKCGKVATRDLSRAPAAHMRYSPMHPRHMRGQRKA